MPRRADRILATHVGSLIRPPALAIAMSFLAQRRLDPPGGSAAAIFSD